MRELLISTPLLLAGAATMASAAGGLPEGTEIRVRTESRLSSKTSELGETVYLRVSDPVKHDGRIVIQDGARVIGRVSAARHRGIFGRSGKLEIAVDSVKIGDETCRLRGAKNASGKGQGTLSIATAVLVAPVAGLITGKSAVVPENTEFIAYTDQEC